MRQRIPRLIMTFPSTTEAIRAEQILTEQKIPGRMIPTPTSITAGCGLAWRSEPGVEEQLREIAQKQQINYEKLLVLEL